MNETRNIPLSAITPSPTNPRKTFDDDRLKDLSDSIRQKGVIQPILVRPIPAACNRYQVRKRKVPLIETLGTAKDHQGDWEIVDTEPEPGLMNEQWSVQDKEWADSEVAMLNKVEGKKHAKSFQLVAGERRFRAARLAGLTEIPATIRDLTDMDVLEIQAIENDQREDVLPSERARGYQALVDAGRTPAQIGEKVGKSEAWVRGVLRLGNLPPEAAEAVDGGELPRSIAELIARVPGEEARKKVSLMVLGGCRFLSQTPRPDAEYLSYRETQELIQSHFSRELKGAAFNTKDESLPPGSCTTCPKRAGNAGPEYATTRGDTCLDTVCFAAKLKLNMERELKTAEADGFTLFSAKELKELFQYGDRLSSPNYVHLDGDLSWEWTSRLRAAGVTTKKKMRGLLGKEELKTVEIYLAHSPAGVRHELVRSSDVKRIINKLYPKKEEEKVDKADKAPREPGQWEIRKRACKEYAEEAAAEIEGLMDDDAEKASAETTKLMLHAIARDLDRGDFKPEELPSQIAALMTPDDDEADDGRPEIPGNHPWIERAVARLGTLGVLPAIAAWATWLIAEEGDADSVPSLKYLTDGSFEDMKQRVRGEMIKEARAAAKPKKAKAKAGAS